MAAPSQQRAPANDRGVTRVLRTAFRMRAETRQTRIPLVTTGFPELSQVHEVGGALCFGARQNQSCGPRRIPPGEKRAKNRDTSCTTGVRSGHGFPPFEYGGKPIGSGYDRSSAEAMTTLGAAIFQNCATSSGAHTCAKAVLSCFASVVWLKGALHGASCGNKLHKGARGLCRAFLCQRHETKAFGKANGRAASKDNTNALHTNAQN